jgi:hypothetical protein
VLVEHVSRFPLDRFVAVGFRPGHLQGLAVHFESIHLLHRFQRGLLAIEDDECLALALQAALSNDVQYGPVVLEDFGECLLHRVDLDTLLKVVDLLLSASRRPPGAFWVRVALCDYSHRFYICD